VRATALWAQLPAPLAEVITVDELNALWQLALADNEVKNAFRSELTSDVERVLRFGRRSVAILRAIGLQWPEPRAMTRLLTRSLIVATLLLIMGAMGRVETQSKKPPSPGYGGEVQGTSKEGYGVSGESGNVGVYAANYSSGSKAYLGARCCAGDFYGDVYIHGNIKVDGAKNFVIDSPLDPANKYLYHASVESSEMKNIYDGVVTLDARGKAVVHLPEWFGALNKDFRYQLTPIGAAAPRLHVAQEITMNRFGIAGGVPGMKVSWMVTGIRDDAWARTHPMQTEELKPSGEVGRYLHPEAWGQLASAGIESARHPVER
jgi:hypothetical protein